MEDHEEDEKKNPAWIIWKGEEKNGQLTTDLKKSQLLTFPFLFSPEMFVLGSRKEEERANKWEIEMNGRWKKKVVFIVVVSLKSNLNNKMKIRG